MTSCGPSLKSKPLTGPTNTESGTKTLDAWYLGGRVWSPWHLSEHYQLCPSTGLTYGLQICQGPIPNGQHAVGGGLWGMQRSSMPWIIGGLQCHWSGLNGPEEWHPHAMWESRDRHRTLSLRPTFTPLSVGASEKGSTLGDTFTPSKATASASILHGFGYGLGGTSSPLLRPLGPPPRILYPSMPMSYGQGILPTLNYSVMGSTMGYNFDPMMGQPLQPCQSQVATPFFPSHLGYHSLPLLAWMWQACWPC